MPRKTRKDKAHVYINADGKDVPSVTHILQLIRKKNVMSWSNYLGFKRIRLKNYVDERALIGRSLHSRINAFFTGGNWEPPLDYDMEQEVDKYWQYFKTWYKEAKPQVIHSELELIGKYYGGTLDVLCRMFTRGVLVDFKTSAATSPTHFLQLGGYLNLLEETRPELYKQIDHCQIVIFNLKDGCIIESKTLEEMQVYKTIFNYAYILYIEYDKLLRRDWNDTLADISIL